MTLLYDWPSFKDREIGFGVQSAGSARLFFVVCLKIFNMEPLATEWPVTRLAILPRPGRARWLPSSERGRERVSVIPCSLHCSFMKSAATCSVWDSKWPVNSIKYKHSRSPSPQEPILSLMSQLPLGNKTEHIHDSIFFTQVQMNGIC